MDFFQLCTDVDTMENKYGEYMQPLATGYGINFVLAKGDNLDKVVYFDPNSFASKDKSMNQAKLVSNPYFL